MQAIFHKHTNNRGFTVVELIVVITVTAILSGMLFGPLNDLYTANVSSSAQITQDSDTRGVLRQIANDLTSTTGFVDTIAVPATPTGSNNLTASWIYTLPSNAAAANVDTDTQVLMGKVYATDLPYDHEDRRPIGAGTACDLSQQTFVQNTYVYFVKLGTLYRRTMVNSPNAGTPCAAISQKQSCQTPNGTNCLASDAVLLRNVRSFLVTYDTPSATAAKAATITVRTQPTSVVSSISPTEASIRISLAQ